MYGLNYCWKKVLKLEYIRVFFINYDGIWIIIVEYKL